MNKDDTSLDDDLRPEYDFSTMRGGVRGKHLLEYRAGTNLVRIAPDVAAAFPTEQAVNDALRKLMQTWTATAKGQTERPVSGLAHVEMSDDPHWE